MSLKRDVFAFLFGVLLILVTFGDDHLGKIAGVAIGNLDTIFGYGLWPVMDVVYPLATIAVFLLYGYMKRGTFRINLTTIFLFMSFLAALALMSIDDIAIALSVAFYPPTTYWIAISLIYPVIAACTFFLFGTMHEKNVNTQKTP
jgi:hypothetical protein